MVGEPPRQSRRMMERGEARALIGLIRHRWWAPILHHSPNEELNAIARQFAAAEGTKAGFPDYILVFCNNGFNGLAFELKAPRPWGRAPTPKQRAWLDVFSEAGWFTGVAYGADEALRLLDQYMQGAKRPRH